MEWWLLLLKQILALPLIKSKRQESWPCLRKYAKCQIQDYQMIQFQVVSVWKKQIGPGDLVRGAGRLCFQGLAFVHSANNAHSPSHCMSRWVCDTNPLGSLSSSAILKPKTIKIKLSCLRNISIREQIPRAMNFSFYLLFTVRHIWASKASTSDSPVVSLVHETLFNREENKEREKLGKELWNRLIKLMRTKMGCHFLHNWMTITYNKHLILLAIVNYFHYRSNSFSSYRKIRNCRWIKKEKIASQSYRQR